MLSELLVFRTAFPKAFRGIRWVATLLFCLLLLTIGLGFIVEIGSSPEQHERHGHTVGRVGR